MMRVAAPFAAVLALAGCAGVGQNLDWPELKSNPREFFNLNPPVRLAAGEPIASPVVLKTGQALIVKLPAGFEREIPNDTIIVNRLRAGPVQLKRNGTREYDLRASQPDAFSAPLTLHDAIVDMLPLNRRTDDLLSAIDRFELQRALMPYEHLLPARFRGRNERIDERMP